MDTGSVQKSLPCVRADVLAGPAAVSRSVAVVGAIPWCNPRVDSVGAAGRRLPLIYPLTWGLTAASEPLCPPACQRGGGGGGVEGWGG